MSKVRDCKARRYGDEWHCNSCGYVWSVDDNDPPTCKDGKQLFREAADRIRNGNNEEVK